MPVNAIKIGKYSIREDSPAFVVAEVGVNHNGSLKLAKKMVDIAKSIGVDAVKFQTFQTEQLATKKSPKANYQKKNIKESQFDMLKKLEFSEEEFKTLFDYCNKKGLVFLSTPFDSESAKFLYKLGVKAFKVGSGDLTNLPLLKQVAKYKRPIILSTGMSDLKEIKEALEVIYKSGNKKVILLHCTSNYPAKLKDANLRVMETLKKKFNLLVGYSDHTLGIEVSTVATAIGACLIEKHFTLDKSMSGPDHKASLNPIEFKELVKSIRNIENIKGSPTKKLLKSEIEIKKVARKSIVANSLIPKGAKIKKDMLGIKRPEVGLRPKYLESLIGKKVVRNIKKDQALTWDLVK